MHVDLFGFVVVGRENDILQVFLVLDLQPFQKPRHVLFQFVQARFGYLAVDDERVRQRRLLDLFIAEILDDDGSLIALGQNGKLTARFEDRVRHVRDVEIPLFAEHSQKVVDVYMAFAKTFKRDLALVNERDGFTLENTFEERGLSADDGGQVREREKYRHRDRVIIERLFRLHRPFGGDRAEGYTYRIVDKFQLRDLFLAEQFGDDKKKYERKYRIDEYPVYLI